MATQNKAFKVKNGVITPAGTTTIEPLIIPHGTAPTTPTNGSIWTTTAGIFVRVNGTTVGPLGAGGGASVTISDTAPTYSLGALWYNSTTGKMLIGYDSYWVELGGSQSTTPSSGGLSAVALWYY